MEEEYPTCPDDFDQFDATLPLSYPLIRYRQLMEERMRINAYMPNQMSFRIWDKISGAACQTIWNLLFSETNPSSHAIQMASELLEELKSDSCFYSPWIYNDWIVLVRDKLLQRNMLDFWKNIIVAKELGPAWARDSDLFDDMDDPEPANFYNYAGCKAVWLAKEKPDEPLPDLHLMTLDERTQSETSKVFKKLSHVKPLEDYIYNMETQTANDPNNIEGYKIIFNEVRHLIWQMLFAESKMEDDNFKKAATLLEMYRNDACAYDPHGYNEWILQLRDKLFETQNWDFWQIIIEKQLGLCCAKDSKYFEDKDNDKPLEFYESGIDIQVLSHVHKK